MTEKSLSEKICEECGIKKKRVELYNCKGCKYLINNECERGDNPCKPKLLEQIKQAIREADWE